MKNHLIFPIIAALLIGCGTSPTISADEMDSPAAASTDTAVLTVTEDIQETPTVESSPTSSPTPTSTATLTPTETPTPITDYSDSIVFVSNRDGNDEIYRMDADGSNVTRLTENDYVDSSPKWSFDKSRIFYISMDEFYASYLSVIFPDGSGSIDLTPDSKIKLCEWSSNSYKIACITAREDGNGEKLIIIDADDQSIINGYNTQGWIKDISWSPDGENIALATQNVPGIVIYNLPQDNSVEYKLGDGLTQKVAWSNNGNRIAYSYGPMQQGVFASVYTVKADGTNPRQRTIEGGPDWVQSWSPGDEYVLIESAWAGPYEIFVVDLERDERVQLTKYETDDPYLVGVNGSPVFSQDGSKIVFSSSRDGNGEIYVMNSDGTDQTNLSNHPAADGSPDW